MSLFRRAALTLLALLPLCLAPGPARGDQPLRVGYIPIADCLQLAVAVEKGFFSDEGLEVETRPLQGGPVLSLAVAAADLDIGWSNLVSLFQAHARGFDFVLLAPGALEDDGAHLTHSLLVRGDSPARTIGDLAGKTVAINALGGVNDLAVSALLTASGNNPQEVRLVEVPFPNMEAALASGAVEAALVPEPFLSSALAHGARRLVATPHAVFGREFMIAGWFAKADWVSAHPGQATAFRRAVDRASAYIADHPRQLPDILARFSNLSPDTAARIVLPGFSTGLDQDALGRAIGLTAAHGLIPQPFPARELLAPGLAWPAR